MVTSIPETDWAVTKNDDLDVERWLTKEERKAAEAKTGIRPSRVVIGNSDYLWNRAFGSNIVQIMVTLLLEGVSSSTATRLEEEEEERKKKRTSLCVMACIDILIEAKEQCDNAMKTRALQTIDDTRKIRFQKKRAIRRGPSENNKY